MLAITYGGAASQRLAAGVQVASRPCQRRATRALANPKGCPDLISIDDDVSSAAELGQPLQYGTALQQGPRDAQEDVVAVQEARLGFLFTAVYDGHNGKGAAQYLVQNLYPVFERLLEEQRASFTGAVQEEDAAGVCCPLPVQNLLAASFKQTDEKLLQWLQEHASEEDSNSGCTATAALVRKDAVIVANVGDSRAVLCRGGQAIDLTAEHRLFGKGDTVKAETQRILEVGGWIDDGRVCGVLAVSRAFGDPEFKGQGLERLLQRGTNTGMWTREFAHSRQFTGDPVIVQPDVSELALSDKDEFLVLATDGLWDVMDSQDVVQLARTNLRKGLTPQAVADKLAEVALKRYTADNVGVVVIALRDLAQAGSSKGGSGKKGLFGMFG